MIKVAEAIHVNPEIGYQEFEASKLLCNFLDKYGIKVQRNVAGMETAFLATCEGRSGGINVALLAEYDALPGIGHGCGHNLIGTAAVGAAISLRKIMPELTGKIVILGSPAEEAGVDGGGGKVKLVEEGILEGIDAALIFHPFGKTTVESESSSLVGLQFEFRGKAAHGAGNPWDGLNALDGVVLTYNNINALRQHIKEDVRIHGVITHGGEAPNIVPEYAAARFFIRSKETDYLEEIEKKVRNCANGAALATGTKVKITRFCNFYQSMKTNKNLANVLRSNLEQLHIRIDGKKLGMGSTDFGNISQVVPSCELAVNIGKKVTPHTIEFAKAARSPNGYETMISAAKVLAMTTVDLLLEPDLIKNIKEEFIS